MRMMVLEGHLVGATRKKALYIPSIKLAECWISHEVPEGNLEAVDAPLGGSAPERQKCRGNFKRNELSNTFIIKALQKILRTLMK